MSETLLDRPTDRLAQEDIDLLNVEFKLLSPRERIRRIHQLFGRRAVHTTTFGPTAPFFLQQAAGIADDITTLNVRHGHETKMTRKHAKFYTKHFNLNLDVRRPKIDAEPRPRDVDATDFQWRAKIEPFGRGLAANNALAYVSGAMDWQTEERGDWQFLEQQGDVLAVRPLLDVQEREVDDFFRDTDLPFNTDYYDPTKGPDQKQECKLNTVDYISHRAVASVVNRPYITLTS